MFYKDDGPVTRVISFKSNTMPSDLLNGLFGSMSILYLLGALWTVLFVLFLPSNSKRIAHILERLREKLYDARFPDYFKLSGVPLPEPLEDFDVDKAKPRPYRPFRWPYHQTMGTSIQLSCVCSISAHQARNISALRKLEHNFWIELESNYRERIVQRKTLYATYGAKVMDKQEGTELASRLVDGSKYTSAEI